MRPVSERLLRTIRGSHRTSTRAYLLTEFQTGTEPTGIEIPVEGGDVDFDANRDIQATLDLSTVFDFDPDGPLSPYGNEIFIQKLVHYGDESLEAVSLGYYRMETGGQTPITTGPVRVTGKDRMSQIIDERRPFPRAFTSGTFFETIFTTLVREVYPDAVLEFDHTPGSLFINRTHTIERDRYKFLRDLATARGKIFYFDHRGVLVVHDAVESLEPVFSIDVGADGVLTHAAHEMGREQVYNGVVAFGEGTDSKPPVSALVTDNNLQSKTFWGGPFGRVPRFYFSTFLTTRQQCISAATKILHDAVGLPYRIDFSMIPNPGLEVRDVVSLEAPHKPTRVQAIETLRIPLLNNEMTGSTKERTGEELAVEET